MKLLESLISMLLTSSGSTTVNTGSLPKNCLYSKLVKSRTLPLRIDLPIKVSVLVSPFHLEFGHWFEHFGVQSAQSENGHRPIQASLLPIVEVASQVAKKIALEFSFPALVFQLTHRQWFRTSSPK